MDKVKLKKIEESIKTTFLFQSVLNNAIERYNKDHSEDALNKIAKLLKQQHKSNQITLQDLGFDFDNTKKIRSLNEKIRELEQKLGSDTELDFQRVNQFVETMKTSLREFLKRNYGIRCFPKITLTSAVSIELEHISLGLPAKDWDLKYCQDEEESAKKIESMKKTHEKSKEFFDFIEENESAIEFRDKHLEVIEIAINDFFKKYGQIHSISHEVVNFDVKGKQTIRSTKFDIVTLTSHQLLSEAFSEY